jgi:CBS domain-containing protein
MKYPSIVSDIMNDIISIDASSRIEEAAKIMIEHKIGSIIVTEEDKPVGIITKTDMLARVIVDDRDPKVHLTRTIMSTHLLSIDKDTSILDAMRFIRDNKIHIVLIKKENDLIGIVSEDDMIRAITLSSLGQFSSILQKK